jgi:hypothetical protein
MGILVHHTTVFLRSHFPVQKGFNLYTRKAFIFSPSERPIQVVRKLQVLDHCRIEARHGFEQRRNVQRRCETDFGSKTKDPLQTGHAKPSGLGMVSMPQHIAGRATQAPDRRSRALMWIMRRRHSSHTWLPPPARTAVKGARSLRVHRSEVQTLDGQKSRRRASPATSF